MMWLTRWLRSVGGRIVLVTVGVAAIAVIVTAVASLGLVQAATTAQARNQLSVQTAALATRPIASLRVLAAEKETAAARGILFGLVDASGQVTGSAVPVAPPRVVRAVLAGKAVSTTVNRGGNSYVVEGRPRAGGGGVIAAQRVEDIVRAGRLVTGQVLLALGIGLVIAVVTGALLARRISRPLDETAGIARRLARGERSVPVPHQRIPEIDDVARALSTLDVALTTSEQRQREFLLSVSHEIRTPLTAIRGYAEALAEGVIPGDESAAVGATLVSETERLDRFVTDLLELARLEADDFAIVPQVVDVADVLGQAARAWQGRCRQLDVALITEFDAGSAPGLSVDSDPMRLRQLVDGLIENALRATPAGGHVVLALRAEGGSTVIDVRDTGPGLTDEDAQIAFERGALHAKYRDVRSVGTGLGLSIASRLADRLGGTVTAGRGPEGGACFSLRLTSVGGTR